jgi:photosystem II stability/assembly factor-like uncharacterized protein
MRKRLCLQLLVAANQVFSQHISFKNIPVDSSYSFRGLSVVDDRVAWVSGIRGIVGNSSNGGNNWTFTQVKGFQKLDFRTLYAFNAQEAIIANSGSPAYILRTQNGGISWDVVYTNQASLAFIDGVDFWNDREGIMYGDPIKGRMLLLHTKDGGKSWEELPEHSRPILSKGEASFAASGTAIRCYKKEKIIIATGGKISRLLVSKDKGKNWNAIPTPIIQGKNSTGIFSFSFVNDTTGAIVGGDYLADALKTNHVFYTTNASKSWTLPETPTGGYRECVEYVNKDTVVAVGPGGTDISYNGAKVWSPIANQRFFHVIRKARSGKLIVAAGNKRIAIVEIKP